MQNTTSRAVCHRPIDAVLPRLLGVKQTAPDRFQAKCPAHDDKSPSLSVRESSDGTVLVKCWASCEAPAIVNAIGLTMRDLFPRVTTSAARVHSPRQAKPVKRPARWYDLENYSDDPMWRTLVARACEERAWKCGVEPFEVRDAAKHSPTVALAIVKEAARMLREFARSEDRV